jgi:putative FmdB family regulatory protein
MPTYVWNCEDHGHFDKIYKMADKPNIAPCPECGMISTQVPVCGGIQGDEPAWLNDPQVLGSLQKQGERPIENRTQYKKYMKDNNIVALD